MADPLQSLHPAVRSWFANTLGEPSPPQALGWPAIAAGDHVLLLAPTGSGKTLAAFLQCLSDLYARVQAGEDLDRGVTVLYVSPLKALNNDIHRNLELPLAGIAAEAGRMGLHLPNLRAAVRTGDTPAAERRRMLAQPPHILITTPESLFLMLTSRAREILRTVRYVIVDEIHALLPGKRGVHLAVSLEHLAELAREPFQRIGLSATVRPVAEAASFLGGGTRAAGGWRPRDVRIIDTGQRKELDLRVILPVEDLRLLPEKTVWPSLAGRILGLVREHRSTLVFVQNRALAERLTARLNDAAGERIAMTHHGSLDKARRLEVECLLKEGRLPCLVATSSLELGIDIGAIDLVVQVESPKEVARGLQRVGRAGHVVGLPSKGRIIPKTRGDLLECAVIAREMRQGSVEEQRVPQNCLDVLAQQLVGLVCMEERGCEELYAIVSRAYPYRHLAKNQVETLLGLLAGAYDDGRFVELQPRIFWDRVNDRIRAADRGRRLVYTSGGTIPDQGYFGVYLEGGVRLGELDEEFVFERRLGDRFVLGTSAWRIEEIRRDRVIVSRAERGGAMVPFWRGEGVGRPYELGCRFGDFLAEAESRLDDPGFLDWLGRECLMDGDAARNLRDYLALQVQALGALPNGRRLMIEEFRDELGEWRIVLHSPYGGRIHGALALLLKEQIKERDGLDVETMHDDNGILFHCPGAAQPPLLDLGSLPLDDLEEALARTVRGSMLFALRFRQNAARALILPKAPYGRKRTPLWLSRLRAADLLQAVSDRPDFPIVLETLRECLTENFDLAGLRAVLTGLRDNTIAVQRVRPPKPSPFSQALQFSFLGTYMYVPDLPKGEQRFRALGLDQETISELLGAQGLRELLDPGAIAATAAEAEGTTPDKLPRNADELHAWLRAGRDLTPDPSPTGRGEPMSDRSLVEAQRWAGGFLAELKADGRVALLSWEAGGRRRAAWVAFEDAPLYLAGLPSCRLLWPEKAAVPTGIQADEARRRLIRRFSKTHGPFTLRELSAAYGLAEEEAAAELSALEAAGLVQSGGFTPGLNETEYCDADLLQRIHRRSLAKARREIEPRGPAEYAAFLARWQRIQAGDKGFAALAEAIARLFGLYLPAAAWGGGVLPLRIADYREEMLARLVGTGQMAWTARGTGEDMKLAFHGELNPQPSIPRDGLARESAKVHDLLSTRGALFLAQIVQGTGLTPAAALEALESLMAAGLATNDTLGPVRYFGVRRPRERRYHLTQADLDAMGRWSLGAPSPSPSPEECAEILLRRYGLVTREHFQRDFPSREPGPGTRDAGLALGDSRPAAGNREPGRGHSWDDILRILDRWEAIGKVRRGYFVEGLGGLQYALPEAVEMLRMPAADGLPEYWAILRCDPANPYGSLLPLPEMDLQPEILVLRRGHPVLAAGGKKARLASLAADLTGEALAAALRLWAEIADWKGEGKISVASFGGRPILETEAAEILEPLGFERVYREMARWGNG